MSLESVWNMVFARLMPEEDAVRKLETDSRRVILLLVVPRLLC